MNVTNATLNDLNEIFKLNNKYFTYEKLSIDSLKNYIENKTGIDTVKVLYDDNKTLVGYIIYRINIDFSELLDIVIVEAERNKGYAKKLLCELETDTKINNSKKILLEVRDTNLVAIDLYKNFGFKIIDIRKFYYKEPLCNALIMEKKC